MILVRSNKHVQRDTLPVSTQSHQAGELMVDVVDISPRDLASARSDPQVIGVAPPMPMHLVRPLSAMRGAPMAETPRVSWGVQAVGATRSAYTGAGITVALLDTGIEKDHPAFKDQGIEIVTKNFTNELEVDVAGHGTHCAGTIFGRPIDGCRIGVAPRAIAPRYVICDNWDVRFVVYIR
jgi:subtilisin family serine protease